MARGLATYNEKRNFGITSEPRGRKAKRSGFSFVVQKHAATRLHYDFRLELDGVLKSWAVTRGPSLVPGEKRLAVHVEDHPLDYGDFEGNIPKGQYGGGAVLVWDRGTWTPEQDPNKGLAKGHLDFSLEGTKLKGRWHLLRLKSRKGERNENWLLIKSDDESARDAGDPDILEEAPLSAKTGRSIEEIAGDAKGDVWQSNRAPDPAAAKKALSPRTRAKAPVEQPVQLKSPKATSATARKVTAPKKKALSVTIPKTARKAKLPGFVEPCLASLSERPPDNAGWLHEIKLDGYRLQAEIDRGSVTLRTRRGLDWTPKFPNLAQEFAALPVPTGLIDGEAVVEDTAGVSDFSALQAALSEGRAEAIVFYAFDLLHIDGYDLTRAPLRERKAALGQLLAGQNSGRLRFSSDFAEGGERLLQHVCRLGAEGIVSKRADEPYRGGRSKGWLKSKCADRQEFVVTGYVPSTISTKAIGSLVVGYYDKGRLMHAGRVGTGYTMRVAQDLFKLLDADRVQRSPFADPLPAEARRDVRFVAPKRVVEVAFRGWTAGNQIRQAAYKGLREDKLPTEVVRESTGRVSDPAPLKQPAPAIRLTHPDRVLWPEAGITKQGLADYYISIWKWIAPHVVGRALSLVRCPTGIAQGCFFQKHEWQGMDRNIELIRDPKDGEKLVSVSNLEGLLALVQASALEIHPWGSRGDDLEHPDRLIFDLDPGENVALADMIAGAFEIRARLAAMRLTSFVKTSGGKGLHVVVPLKPSAGWEEAKTFCRLLAESMEKDAPQRYTATVAKKARTGRIYVDYLRNGRGATAIVPYSPRARAVPGIATPLSWEELPNLSAADLYTMDNIGNRMAHLGADPWAAMPEISQTLPQAKPPVARKQAGSRA
ncbi:MAG: DNA ligase D [Beijerinckiaceae bacterium]